MIEKRKIAAKSTRKASSPKDQILKALTKCAKAIKTSLVLKLTKKLQELKQNEDDGSTAKREKLLEKLKEMKALNHQLLGRKLSKERFPSYFETVDTDEEFSIDNKVWESVNTQQKLEKCVQELQSVVNRPKRDPKRDSTSQKRPNDSQPPRNRPSSSRSESGNSNNGSNESSDLEMALKLRKSKMSHAGKIARKKAVFVDSLNGEGDDEAAQGMDEADRVRLEKSIRNRQNRAKNRALREQEQKEQMAIYGPDAEKKHGELRKEYGGTRKFMQDRQSQQQSFNDRGRSQRMERSRPVPMVAPPKLVAATKPIIENAKQDELAFMAKSGKEWKETGVHPSWAAKKINQTAAIVPSQGTKIVFDD